MKSTSPNDLRIVASPSTLRAMAAERMREAIVMGVFSSGDRLVERVLCEQLGVSRSVVREAIRTLEAEGLVETPPRSGPVVARLDWRCARQIYDIRRLIEADAAAACAHAADSITKSRLATALKEIERSAKLAEAHTLYRATTDFYEIIFQAAGHEVAWEIVQRLNSRISRLRALTLASTERRVSGPVHMARIYKAISANDASAARIAVCDHLLEAAEIARQILERES